MPGNLRPPAALQLLQEWFIFGTLTEDDWGPPHDPRMFIARARTVGLLKSGGVECTGTGYTRKLITNWTLVGTGNNAYVTNNAPVSWTGGDDWGTIMFAALFGDGSNAQEFARAPITPVIMGAGVTLTFNVGNIVFHFD